MTKVRLVKVSCEESLPDAAPISLKSFHAVGLGSFHVRIATSDSPRRYRKMAE